MNSMMLIGLNPTSGFPVALDANTTLRADHRGMARVRGEQQPVARLEVDRPALVFEHESDRTLDAVENLLVGVGVGCVVVAGPVGPRVAAAGLVLQPSHQVLEPGHEPILQSPPVREILRRLAAGELSVEE